MKLNDAEILADTLTAQAAKQGLKGADGNPLQFRPLNLAKDNRSKGEWTVEIIEMVERQNLMSGKSFWIDIRTPVYLDPSRESYWSM